MKQLIENLGNKVRKSSPQTYKLSATVANSLEFLLEGSPTIHL